MENVNLVIAKKPRNNLTHSTSLRVNPEHLSKD